MAEKHGYEDWTVEQLRTELYNKYKIDAYEVKGKITLVNKLVEMNNMLNTTADEKSVASSIFEGTDLSKVVANANPAFPDDGLPGGNIEDAVAEPARPDVIPEYGSEEWQTFLISQLSAKEKEGNYPKAFGLRRLAQKYLGDIVESGPIQVFAPTAQDEAGRATVVWRLVINWKIGQPEYVNIDHYNPDRREFSDVADVWVGNVPAAYAIHPSATAATRAEGRALKKALMLNVLTAEEMSNDKNAEIIVEKQIEKLMGKSAEWSEEDKITSSQKNFIVKKCEAMSIELIKFINKSHYVYGEELRYKSLDDVSRGVASSMIEEINRYQCESANPAESKTIPEQIKLTK